MKTLVSLVTIGLFVVSGSLAQDFEFRVLVNKGQNTAKASGSDWAPIRTGSSYNKGDELKVGENGYLGLMHKSGKTTEITNPGSYKVDELAAPFGSNNSSVITKYADFVLSKMTPEQKEENRRKYAGVTGAVSRDVGDKPIKVLMPTSADFYDPTAIITWEGEENKTYQVTLKNMFDEVILSSETSDSFHKINFDESKLAEERLVILNVSEVGNEDVKSGDYGIKRLTSDDAQKFEGELNELKASLTEESSLNKLILAEFFEQNNLLIDATTNYMLAIELSPDVDYFKEVYQEFKLRNGLGK